jgi:hypothetical protein
MTMGRGLSDLQKGILGIAHTINAHTQGGVAKVKPADFSGPVDYRTALGVCLLYQVAPSCDVANGDHFQSLMRGSFENTPEVKRAKAAASRAVSHLVRRGLLAYHTKDCGMGGYILTETGIEVGKANPRPVPLIGDSLIFFSFTTREQCPSMSMCGRDYMDELTQCLATKEGGSK